MELATGLKAQLEQLATLMEEHGQDSLQGVVLRHGQPYEYTPRPESVPLGEAKMCYANALHLARERDWTYVEGYVLSAGVPIAIHHAWVLTPEGEVVDPTLREPRDGTICGFCLGEGINTEEETDCRWCEGTGEDTNATACTERAYYGVALDLPDVIQTILKKGVYGVIEDVVALVE